ncbi:hypothetical protein Y788_11445 [Pantoea dispersa 625]|nr:hypothetical protein Y788_11445 [Pantoea dispersa 625]
MFNCRFNFKSHDIVLISFGAKLYSVIFYTVIYIINHFSFIFSRRDIQWVRGV